MIPLSVIILVKNEALNVSHSIPPLIDNFDDVHVVDSHSTDRTADIARDLGAIVHQFSWDGRYPKKKQWALDTIETRHDRVLMIDADEIVTDAFLQELRQNPLQADGYFVSSKMMWKGRKLEFGQRNNKLCLFKKSVFAYPPVNDLDIQGGWEVEGHYQPISKSENVTIGQIRAPLIHHDRKNNWEGKHDSYTLWEVGMNRRNAWPVDPVPWREWIKSRLRRSPFRPFLIFAYGYVLKLGFLDGVAGFDYAYHRALYAWRINARGRDDARQP